MKLLAGLLVAGALTGTVAPNVSREQAAAFQKKLDGIIQHSEAATETARQTDISEGEVNRTSISAPVTRFRSGSPNLQSPFRPKAGSMAARGRPRSGPAQEGQRQLVRSPQLSDRAPAAHSERRAANSRRPRPVHARKRRDQRHSDSKTFLQEIVSYYSRTPEYPNGVRIDDPFDLPADIQKIDVQPGRAIIIQ